MRRISQTAIAMASLFGMVAPIWAGARAGAMGIHRVGSAEASHANEARGVLADALARAKEIKEASQQSAALEKIVEVQVKAGDLAGAEQVAASITDSDRRARAYAGVAYALATRGNVSGAYAVAEESTRGEATGMKLALAPEQQKNYRNMVLKAIASAEASLGDVAAVSATAAKATQSPGAGNDFLRLMAKAEVKAGDSTGAEKSFVDYVRSMPDAGVMADVNLQALELLCEVQLESGDVAGAQATADRVRNGAMEATLLADVATVQAGGAQGSAADAAAMRVSARNEGAGASVAADATKYNPAAAAKNVAKALELAAAYRDLSGFDKSNAMMKIAAAQAALHDFQGALQTAQKTSDSFAKNQALALIAVGQAKANDVTGAQQTANSIVNDASAKNREDAMAEVAIALAEGGDIPDAQKTENLLPMDYDVSAVSSALAVAQAQAGEVKTALTTVDRLNERDRRGWRFKLAAVNSIALAQGRKGDVAGARVWINTLGSVELEASALCGLAEGLTESDGGKTARLHARN